MMNNSPILSVIMSVYNGEKYLHEAMDSILNQTFKDFEFIIIEDASTDRTLEIIEKYRTQDSRIVLITKKENKGPKGFIENLNLGLNAAKGQFIARMDADDISDLNRFEKQVDFLQKSENIFMVGSDLQLIDQDGLNTNLLPAYHTDEDIQKNMFKNISMYHPVILFRNNKKISYREKMLYCEDYDLYFRLMIEGYKFANIQEPLLKYRILEDSISRKDSKMIRWLFVEKARSFFIEQKEKGEDSYENFDPENYLNILKPNYNNTVSDLLFAAKTALKYQNHTDLKSILTKTNANFPNEKKFQIYNWYLKIPKSMLPYFTKILYK
ncbi:glycosyltransferase [Kaistella sp. SH19-2b]|uniref:glycosyltransferase family 2 protein n=2 Tax=Kaistella TaxID=2782231 RepID=UPI002732A594|nr:glycosyltransferase [Kaistella sp. SH19-2b]MDP2460609.1 glycosyltransferase [Kaistella sp. SH19-2b]